MLRVNAVGGASSPSGSSRSSASSSFAHEDHHGDSAGASAAHERQGHGSSHGPESASRSGRGAGPGGESHDDGRTSAERRSGGPTTAERHAGGLTTAERLAGGHGQAAQHRTPSYVGRDETVRGAPHGNGFREAAEAASGNRASHDGPTSRHAGVASNVGDSITGLTNFGIDGMGKASAHARMREVGSWIANDAHGEMRALGLDHETIGRGLQSPWRNIGKSSEMLKSGMPERWAGKVADAMESAGRAGTRANVIGLVAAPAVGMVQGLGEARPGATLGERVASVVGGGLRELDDSVFSAAAGAAAGLATAATGPGAVVASTAAGITAAHYYEGSRLDKAADARVDRLEVGIASTVDRAVNVLGSIRSFLRGD